ncbi:MAG TPA: radical SAM protein, partial [Candidatus Omnitrophota bacterium]|nr:radical SAM protein [Candidatus Omnitrophota bacterium]
RSLGCTVRLLDCLDRFHPAITDKIKKNSTNTYGSGPYYSETIDKPTAFKYTHRKFKRYGLPIKTVKNILEKESTPDIILVTTGMTYWYPAYIDMIALLKELFPESPIVLGGNYPNLCYDHANFSSGADYIFKGTDISRAIEFLDKILGGRIIDGQKRPLPQIFPAYDLYRDIPYITLKTSHGCPFRCTYCGWYLVDEIFNRQLPELVIEEIAHFHHDMGITNFAFYDDALLFKADEHFIKIASGIIEKGIKANFLTPNGLHNKFLSEDVAHIMKEAGFQRPRLALETSREERQISTGGKTTNKDFGVAAKNLIKAGYGRSEIGVYLLIGLPGQSMGEIDEAVRFVSNEGFRIHLEEYSPIPGTPDYEKSGLKADSDPLMHNNSVFPLYHAEDAAKVQRLKDLAHDLNKRLRVS